MFANTFTYCLNIIKFVQFKALLKRIFWFNKPELPYN